MKEIEIFDPELQKTFKLNVENDEYNEIVVQGNLTLATTLLEKQQAKENFVAAYKLLQNESRNELYSSKSTSQSHDNTGSESTSNLENTLENNKTWNRAATKLLITLCKKYDNEFETGIKKHVWNKISKQMTENSNNFYTSQQCDTKFKGLKNTYKQVKKHNEQSGNSIKTWEYYDEINDILYSKPEINPIATCSSKSGLVVMGTPSRKLGDGHMISDCEDQSSSNEVSPGYNSCFMRKRKTIENVMERRHKEKMARQDRYLDLLERMTTAIEKNGEK